MQRGHSSRPCDSLQPPSNQRIYVGCSQALLEPVEAPVMSDEALLEFVPGPRQIHPHSRV